MLDLRIPTGWFFSILGVILVGQGIFARGGASLTTLNVNLYSGLPMLIFGCVMLLLAHRGRT
jgi:hypothetical protein